MIKGITVTLYEKTKTGTDDFNQDIFEEVPVEIEDVLVAPAQSQEIIDGMNLYGKKAVFTLGIPKKDEHDWEDKRIEFYFKNRFMKVRSFGFPLEGIECNIPLKWNKKVMVEMYG